MKFFAVLGLVGAAVAYSPCSGLQGVPQCCGTNVLNVATLNCDAPHKVPSSASDFKSICASGGQAPMCCTLPLLGQGLLCVPPVGV